MNIISAIIDKIFHRHAEQTDKAPDPAASFVGPPTPAATPTLSAAPVTVDVSAVLAHLALQHGEKLNWKTSIVDLLKVLNLDSSLTARQQLATELKFGGDMKDSASMNIWLQKQVMQKLADNGGHVPDELRH